MFHSLDSETSSPPAISKQSSTKDPTHAIDIVSDNRSNDLEPQHSPDVSPDNPGNVSPTLGDVSPKDVVQYPEEETFERAEDSRSIAGSSSYGFESPDDEDHELRMRYLPSGDTCEDDMYQIQDQRLESDSGENPAYGPLYSTSAQHSESNNEGDTSERHASGDELSNTDATCIPTDSTYINYSEHSADENVDSRHDYDSSADMVDSTVSDLSESEQPAGGSPDRKQDEPKRGGTVVDKEFTLVDENAQNANKSEGKSDRDRLWKQGGYSEDISQHCVQDETISGHEGDDDATDEEAEHVDTSGRLVDNRGEVMDTRSSEVDSSEDVEVMRKIDSGIVRDHSGNIVNSNDSTVMDKTGHVTISTKTGRQFGTVEGKPETSVDTMKTSEDTASREQADESKDTMEQQTIQEDNVDKILDRTAGIYSTNEVSPSDDGDTADSRKSLEYSTRVLRSDSTNGTGDAAEDITPAFDARNEVTKTVAGYIDSGTDHNVLDGVIGEKLSNNNTPSSKLSSQNTKEVSSSSDTGEVSQRNESLENENICEANQSSDSQHEVHERSTRDEGLIDATDRVDSSTDRENNYRDGTEEDVSFLDEYNVRMNLAASRKSDEVTSSDEHVERPDEEKTSQDDHMDQNEHVTVPGEHVTDHDKHVIVDGEHVDSNIADDQNQRGKGNEVGGVKTTEVNSALDDEDVTCGMDTTDDRDSMVTSAEDTTLRDVQEREGNDVQREDIERVYQDSNSDPTIESTSSTGHVYTERNNVSSEAVSSDQCMQRVSTTDDDLDNRLSTDDVTATSYINQGIHEEDCVKNATNDITSTVEERNIVSQHDADTSSTFDTARPSLAETGNESESLTSTVSTSNNIAKQSDDVASSSSVAMRRDDVATSSITKHDDDVATSSVVMQQDGVTIVSDAPNISDVSSSDTSENVENDNEPESHMNFADSAENLNPAESRTNSSEVDFPDSAENANKRMSSHTSRFEADSPDSGHIADRHPSDSTRVRNQDLASLSRRSSEDSEEPSTTNLNERTLADSYANDHENISENEAESLTNYEESEIRTERNSGVHLLDNIVDSSTVSPVSFTDEVGHADDMTGYLGSNSDITANASENIVDTTEYLGLNRDDSASDNNVQSTGYFGNNSGSMSTPEGTVGTTVGITSSTKYDITVEAISSDEELEEGEIAETPDDATRNNVTACDVSPEHMITSSSSGSYYPPLDTIPISPPADSDEPSSSSFLDFGTYPYSSTQLAGSSTQPAGSSTQLPGSSRVTHSVFPFSALNVRSAPNSNCSSPVAVGFASGCNTPIRFQQADSTPIRFQPADSSNMLTPQYEPLSDDESSESHDTDARHSSIRDTDSN